MTRPVPDRAGDGAGRPGGGAAPVPPRSSPWWWRLAVAVAGLSVVLLGIVLLALPGPGLLVILAGLAILATEFHWARRALTALKRHATRLRARALDHRRARDAAPGG